MGICNSLITFFRKNSNDSVIGKSISDRSEIQLYFMNAFHLPFSLYGFYHSKVFSTEFPLGTFNNSSQVSLKTLIQEHIAEQIILFNKRNNRVLNKLKIDQEIFLAAELDRSIAAHILKAPQIYSPYFPRIIQVNHSVIDDKFIDDWVLEQNFKEDPKSKDVRENERLELAFAKAVYMSFIDYPFEKHLLNIINNIM